MYILALFFSKLAYALLRLLRRNASHFPGEVALRICPKYLEKAKKPPLIICVTGTDGKTTTANLLADALIASGKTVASNRLGSNTIVGVASLLSESVTWGGKPKADALVLEVDEHHARLVTPRLKANYLVVTNLIRDSLKRNAHPEYVFNKVNACDSPDTTVILNADELCSARLLPDNRRIFYGIDRLPTDLDAPKNIINDNRLCPSCGAKLMFDYVRYCHIGHVHCDACGFASPQAQLAVQALGKDEITVRYDEQTFSIPSPDDGIFNVYNRLCVLAVLLDLGMTPQQTAEIFGKISLTKTRFDAQTVGGVQTFRMMAKSNCSLPVSLVFDYLAQRPAEKAVLMNLDDLEERNAMEYIGWIYDADYEFLNNDTIVRIVVTGARRFDHALRLYLAGVNKSRVFVEADESEAVARLREAQAQEVFFLYDMSNNAGSVRARDKFALGVGGAQ